MSTELESLPDDKLSEVFAVECGGWKRRRWNNRKGYECTGWDAPDGRKLVMGPPAFATSADAVLPFLDAWDECKEHHQDWHFYSNPMHGSSLCLYRDGEVFQHGVGPLARAACIALIKAKRAEKGANERHA